MSRDGGGATLGRMTSTAPPPPPPEPRTDEQSGPWDGRNRPGRPTAGPFAGGLSARALRRSRADRKVAGVAGGLGRWLDVDPTVLRVVFVVLAFFGGSGVVLYGVAWLVVPEEGATQGTVPTGETVRTALLIGALTVAVVLALAGAGDGHVAWPVLVVGLVLAVVLVGRDNRRSAAGRSAAPGTSTPPPAPHVAQSSPPPSPPSSPQSAPAGSGTEPTVVLEKQPAWHPPVAPLPVPERPRRTGPLLFGPALALLALGLGVLGLYDAQGGDVAPAAYPALALTIVGLLLIVGAFVGRPGGLVLLGLVAALALPVTAIADPTYSGSRDLQVAPTSAAGLLGAYHVPAGRIRLDLRNLDPATLDGRSLDVSVGAGEVVVLVPQSVQVSYDAVVDFGGHIDVDGRVDDGWSPELRGTDGPPDPQAGLALQLSADFGQLRLVRS